MEISDKEAQDLARLFARRFASYEQRAFLAGQAGLAGDTQLAGDAFASWCDIMKVAVQKDSLVQLVRLAARQRPADKELQKLLDDVQKGRIRRGGGLVWAAVALAVGAGIAGGWWFTQSATDDIVSDVPKESASQATFVAPPDPGASAPSLQGESPTAMAPAQTAEAPVQAAEAPVQATEAPVQAVEAPKEAPKPAETPPPVAEAPKEAVSTDIVPGRCGGPRGERLGYWYAGDKAPGTVGSVITVWGGANVRSAYPTRANQFNARSQMTCGLLNGDRVKLSEAPIQIEGGTSYWVPFRAGDLLAPDATP